MRRCVHRLPVLRGREQRLDERQIRRRRHLEESRVALCHRDPPSGALDERRAVGCLRKVARQRTPKSWREERLGRLRTDEIASLDRLHDDVAVDALDGVRDRKRRNDAVETLREGRSTRSTTASSSRGRAAS